MKIKDRFTFDEFLMFSKTAIKNVSKEPSRLFIDKIDEIYERKKNEECSSPFSNEFIRASNKIEYWLQRGWDTNEAELKRLEKVNASSCSLNALISKHGIEKGKILFDEINNKKSNSLDGFIKRHGKEKGKKLFDEYKIKMSRQNTLDGMIETYGSEEGTIRFNSMISLKKNTLENSINRYGFEEGTKRFFDANKKRGRKQTFLWFEEQFGSDAKLKWEEHISEKSKRNSLDYFKEKFGEEQGIEKYNKWFESTIGNKSSFSNSKVATSLFEKLELAENGQFGENEAIITLSETEKQILNRQFIRPDFLLGNKVIEFYGTYWHCHKSIFKPDQFHKQHGKIVKEIWEYDDKKNEILKSKGFDILIVWEHEFNNDKESIIEKCNNFLNVNETNLVKCDFPDIIV